MKLTVNGKQVDYAGPADKPLLWVLREDFKLTATRYGCGVSACGACTVHLDGEAVRSCTLPVSAVDGAAVTTLEGLGDGKEHPVQQAWTTFQVPQCGYCQSGQIMSAAALLSHTPLPTDDDINAAMSGNLCRCGTYQRIRKAIHLASELAAGDAQGQGSKKS